MGKILEFPVLQPGTMATLLTSAGFYSGKIVSIDEDICEMENVKFFAYANPAAALELPFLFLKSSEIQGCAAPIDQARE